MENTNQAPQFTQRLGTLSVSVWRDERENANGRWLSFSAQLQRRFRDPDSKEWRFSPGLFDENLPAAIHLLNLAQAWIDREKQVFEETRQLAAQA